MSQESIILYAVSDATGDLTVNIAVAAARQFRELNSDIRRRPLTNTQEKIRAVIQEAKKEKALILHTLVAETLRHYLMEEAKAQGVTAVDVMGPVLKNIAEIADLTPSDQPGLQYQMTGDYMKRTEVMTFTVKHDDGQGLDSLNEADIILLGISRTSKTPLSVYLAFRGYRAANVPLVKGVDAPTQLKHVDPGKLVGLTVEPEKLVALRTARLQKLGRPLTEDYATLEFIKEELAFQRQIFVSLGNIPVVNMSHKGIEEAATEILTVLGK